MLWYYSSPKQGSLHFKKNHLTIFTPISSSPFDWEQFGLEVFDIKFYWLEKDLNSWECGIPCLTKMSLRAEITEEACNIL